MITVFRIGADTPAYTADDRTGAGAERSGGRWNAKGTPVLYTSRSRALACVETIVHLSRTGALPYNRYLVEYHIPESSWTARALFDASVAIGWDALPPGQVSQSWGTAWLRAGSSLVAEVPSVIVPEESNVLFNPGHPDMARVTVRKVRRWLYDARLVPAVITR